MQLIHLFHVYWVLNLLVYQLEWLSCMSYCTCTLIAVLMLLNIVCVCMCVHVCICVFKLLCLDL